MHLTRSGIKDPHRPKQPAKKLLTIVMPALLRPTRHRQDARAVRICMKLPRLYYQHAKTRWPASRRQWPTGNVRSPFSTSSRLLNQFVALVAWLGIQKCAARVHSDASSSASPEEPTKSPMPLRLVKRNKYKVPATFSTRKRVIEGLRAAAITIWKGDVKKLPTSTVAYASAARATEGLKPGQAYRLYPPSQAILNHFETMNHAWWALGYEVATLTRKKLHRIMTPAIHKKLEYIYQFQGLKQSERPADAPTLRAYAEQLSKELRTEDR